MTLGGAPALGHGRAEESPLTELNRAREFIKEKLKIVQQDQKDVYDESRQSQEQFTIGDLVLVNKHTRKVGRSEKLLAKWQGPYEIMAQPHELNYEIKLPNAKKSQIAHVKDIKRYHAPVEWAVENDREEVSNERSAKLEPKKVPNERSAKLESEKVTPSPGDAIGRRATFNKQLTTGE